jgi:thiamine-phosphate pyrophosphorylase
MMRGLYLITPDRRDGPTVLGRAVEAALRGGAQLVQYRDKSTNTARRLAEAQALKALCTRFNVPLLINDDVDLADAVSADGVHLGQDDVTVATARAVLGPDSLIGVTCHDRIDLAQRAAEHGADYIAFGSFFASPSKPEAIQAPRSLMRKARRSLALPIVAIGGISPENGASLVRDGADMLAVISAVFAAADISAAARSFADCFTPIEETDR